MYTGPTFGSFEAVVFCSFVLRINSPRCDVVKRASTATGAAVRSGIRRSRGRQTRPWQRSEHSHPRSGRVPAGAPPTIRSAAGGPGGRWGSVVLGWRALRPPRVVFVLGFVSLINFLTSGKILGGTVHGFTFWDRSQIHCGHTFILSRVSKHKGEFDLEPFFKRDV